MSYKKIIAEVAKETGSSVQWVDRVYKAYWRGVREHITSLPLKSDITEEEFSKLQPNVNIPSIGKLHVSYRRYHQIRTQHLIIQENKKRQHVTH